MVKTIYTFLLIRANRIITFLGTIANGSGDSLLHETIIIDSQVYMAVTDKCENKATCGNFFGLTCGMLFVRF